MHGDPRTPSSLLRKCGSQRSDSFAPSFRPIALMKTTLLLILSLLLLPLPAADWPHFRGPTGDGVTGKTSLPLKWSEKENLVWRTRLPEPGSSSPIVVGDRVFLTCHSGYGTDAKEPGD